MDDSKCFDEKFKEFESNKFNKKKFVKGMTFSKKPKNLFVKNILIKKI